MSEQFYIRIRGEVRGPMTHEQVATLVRRKRLGRHHDISTDAVSWQKASELPQFFEPVVAAREVVVEPFSPSGANDQIRMETPTDGGGSAETSTTEWFYSKEGEMLGPVSESRLKALISSGELDSSDMVWNETFTDWKPLSELQQFGASSRGGPEKRKKGKKSKNYTAANFWEILMGTSKAAKLPDDSIHKYPNLSRYLGIAESILRILFVLMLFLHIASWMYVVGQGVHVAVTTEEWTIVIATVIAGPIGAVILWFAFISMLAVLEIIRVIIQIEDNTAF